MVDSRNEDPDQLWKMIEDRDSRIRELQKYEDFYKMLQGLFTPPIEREGEENND